MEFSKINYSKFLFDPSDSDLLVKLSRHKEFAAKVPNKRKVVQYIILMYDKNNEEIRAEYPFYPQRKLEIAKCIGLVEGKKATKAVEDILIGKSKEVNDMIIRYLVLFDDPDLVMLAAYQEIFTNLNKASFAGETSKEIIASIEKLNDSIKEVTERIFGGKDETELRQELYKSIEEQSLGIRPEEVAEALQSGKDPLKGFSPYQSDYLPESIRFLGDR